MLLPTAAIVSVLLQLTGGLPTPAEWVSLACFALTCYLMVELSNGNSLLRVRSRMVTSTFIVLSGAAGCLFGTVNEALLQLFAVIAVFVLFTTYQDSASPGRTFYAFVALGVAGLLFVPTLYYVPVIWILMGLRLQSLSLRTWTASLLGVLTPCWLVFAWLFYQQDLQLLADHFALSGHWTFPPVYASVGVWQWVALLFTLMLAATGAIHFWTHSYEDKIRIRHLYGFFTTITVVTTVFIALLPNYFGQLMRLLLITASPLTAHFFAHTSSRLTNILFIVVIILAFAVTLLNIFL